MTDNTTVSSNSPVINSSPVMSPPSSSLQQSSSPPPPTINSSLPPVKELFIKAWQALMKSLLNLFLLNITALVATILLIISAIALFFISGLGTKITTVISQINTSPASIGNIDLSLFTGIGLGIIIYSTLFYLVGCVVGITSIIIVGNYENPIPLSKAIKKSFSLIIPLFVVNLILGFFNLGSLFVLILPALIFSYFFMYAGYEAILVNKRALSAIKSSIRIVSSHFGEIIARLFIYILFYILVVVFIPNLISRIDPQTGKIITGLSFILNYVIGWFGLSYSIVLYQQAKAATDEGKKISMVWVWIITIIGYLILALVIFGTYRLFIQAWESGYFKKIYDQQRYPQKQLDYENVTQLN